MGSGAASTVIRKLHFEGGYKRKTAANYACNRVSEKIRHFISVNW